MTKITEDNVWEFIDNAKKVLFPQEIKSEWTLLAEYIPAGEPWLQYRLYESDMAEKMYAKIHISSGENV